MQPGPGVPSGRGHAWVCAGPPLGPGPSSDATAAWGDGWSRSSRLKLARPDHCGTGLPSWEWFDRRIETWMRGPAQCRDRLVGPWGPELSGRGGDRTRRGRHRAGHPPGLTEYVRRPKSDRVAPKRDGGGGASVAAARSRWTERGAISLTQRFLFWLVPEPGVFGSWPSGGDG
jgi:hypothetical protein